MRCLILLITLLLTSCREAPAPREMAPVDVTYYVVEPRNVPLVYEYIGFADSSHPVEIRARVQGYLSKIAYVEGDKVKEGDLLFQIDPVEYEAKVEQAKGDVARQEAQLENARLTTSRLKPLYSEGAASKRDLDNALSSVAGYEAALRTANALLNESEINLGYTTIRSPITGYADRSSFREGALITPGPNNLLTTVSVLDPIWLYFTVSESDILRLRHLTNDASVTVPRTETISIPSEEDFVVEALLSDGTSYPHKGRIDFGSPTYDRATGSLLVRAVLPNPDGDIRPGEFLRVRIFGIERTNALAVPRRALVQKQNGNFVYLIKKDLQVVAQDVITAEWHDDFQVVSEGLAPGDRIVVDGINKILPGTHVNPIKAWNP